MSAAKRQLLILAGPTASGKTSLALKLADTLPLTLISADSMQVYRGMDIGTAKPMGDERKRFALVDVVDPGEPYSAGRFAREASIVAEKAWANGQLPCLVGGSGLYIRALTQGIAEIPDIPAALREKVESMAPGDKAGQLQALDPEAAASMDLQNPRRTGRALEVLLHTGKSIREWQKASHATALRATWTLGFCLCPPIEELALRIRQRNNLALAAGWRAEAQGLAARFGAEAVKGTGAIGYTELLDMGENEARPVIETRTLQYARRQRTWFRKEDGLRWASDPKKIEDEVTQFIKG